MSGLLLGFGRRLVAVLISASLLSLGAPRAVFAQPAASTPLQGKAPQEGVVPTEPAGSAVVGPKTEQEAVAAETMPRLQEVRVLRSNYRRAVWGRVLTISGVVGIMVAAAGMVLVGQGADRYRALSSLPKPLVPASQTRLDELTRQRRAGIGMFAGGASLGLLGLIAGPLLVRSAHRREKQRQMLGWAQFRPRLSFSLVYRGLGR